MLHSGTRQRLADLGIGHLAPPTPCCRFGGYDYLTATQAGLSWAEPAPIGGLIFPRRQSGVAPKLTPLTPGEVARQLFEHCFDLQQLGEAATEVVATLAECPSVEVDFDAADQVTQLLTHWAGQLALGQFTSTDVVVGGALDRGDVDD